ncbi:MAG: polysaccharide deacetylase family protein [bacterium]
MGKNIAIWLGVEVEKLKDVFTTQDLDLINEILCVKEPSLSEQILRKFLQPILSILNSESRYKFTNLIKKLKGVKGAKLKDVNKWELVIFLQRLKQKLSINGMTWNGKKASLCLTHDVDYLEDFQNIDYIIDMEQRFGLKSSFNFLTSWDYKIEKQILKRLLDNGFEIGLHGHTHDVAFGYRSKEQITTMIKKARDELGVEVAGFRTPTLAISRKVLEVLEVLKFKYDTSILGSNVEICFPYQYPGLNIWELPLTLQDNFLFRDQNLTQDEGFEFTRQMIEDIIKIGGLVVLNLHPQICKINSIFYEKLVNFISQLKDVWKTTPIQVIEYLEGDFMKVFG